MPSIADMVKGVPPAPPTPPAAAQPPAPAAPTPAPLAAAAPVKGFNVWLAAADGSPMGEPVKFYPLTPACADRLAAIETYKAELGILGTDKTFRCEVVHE